jgi:hypothetical protein
LSLASHSSVHLACSLSGVAAGVDMER